MKKLLYGIASILLAGCMGMPKKVTSIKEFELERYLGKWYEIARLDHSFENGLSHVTATYSLRDDGGITVRNRGYSAVKQRWSEADGKAYFAATENEGYFKVSFFGPFYSSYVIFGLDKDKYDYAFISGYNTSYLWFLSRTPTVDKQLKLRFIKKAQESGFNTDQLIFVKHD